MLARGSNPTLINGGAGPVVLNGITKGLKVELKDGDDNLQLFDGAFADDVEIKGGDGANWIQIFSFDFGGDFEVRGEEGFDLVVIANSNFYGNAKFEYHDGGDDGSGSFRSGVTSITNGFFDGNVTIKGEDGIDSVLVQNTTVDGNLKFEANQGGALYTGQIAGGAAFFANSAISGNFEFKNEVGIDQFNFSATNFGGDVKIEFGDGADDGTGTILGSLPSSISNSAIDGNFEIRGGSGLDLPLTITNSTFLGNAKIDHGKGGSTTSIISSTVFENLEVKSDDGMDAVLINSSTLLGDTRIKTGKGDDFVSIRDSFFAALEADGGDGFDEFEELGTNTVGKTPKSENFEVFLP